MKNKDPYYEQAKHEVDQKPSNSQREKTEFKQSIERIKETERRTEYEAGKEFKKKICPEKILKKLVSIFFILHNYMIGDSMMRQQNFFSLLNTYFL